MSDKAASRMVNTQAVLAGVACKGIRVRSKIRAGGPPAPIDLEPPPVVVDGRSSPNQT